MTSPKPMSIYSQARARTGPVRLARPSTPPSDLAHSGPANPATPPPLHEVPAIAIEAAMLAVLASQPRLGETIEVAFRRIEHELGEQFARLPPVEARALKLRLEQPRDDDALAARFNRLVAVRRLRLLTFLGDARRRHAIEAARIA